MPHETKATGSTPLIQSLANRLAGHIRAGRFDRSEGFPSERDLALEYGISRTAVRHVLNILEADGLIVRRTRCRTMVRHRDGERERAGVTARRSLGLWLWPGLPEPNAAGVFQGLCQVTYDLDYRLVVGQITGTNWEAVLDSEARFLSQLADDADFNGAILWYLGARRNLEALLKVRAAGVPMVFIDRRPPEGIEADYVGVDNVGSAEQVVRHLLSLGHRRIAHITNLDTASPVADRLDGYRRMLNRMGIPLDPDLVVAATENSFAESPPIYDALLDRLLGLKEPPTAVFTVNDIVANRLLLALERRGIAVPDRMAVAGFDGVRRWQQGAPNLTTAFQPFERMGFCAGELLLDRIGDNAGTAFRHLLLEAPLEVSGTTVQAV